MREYKTSAFKYQDGIALAFVAYEEYCTKTVYIYQTDKGFAAVNCVDGEFSNKAYVYSTLFDLINDYYVNMLYMISYCRHKEAETILQNLLPERKAMKANWVA